VSDPAAVVLAQDFPALWKQFGKQAQDQHADYVIGIDVSGSMARFKDVIVPALGAFIDSLPEGDYVSVVLIGTGARIAGVPSVVNDASKASIRGILGGLNYKERPFSMNTDLALGSEKILEELNRPGGNDLKFVFVFTDFDHDPAPDRSGKEGWDALRGRFLAEQSGHEVNFYAMKLQLTAKSGRDMDKVQGVFPNLQLIPVDPATLGGWFQRRKAEILRDRLRHIVAKAASGKPPTISAKGDGPGIKVMLDSPGANELINGVVVQSATFTPRQGSASLVPSQLPVTLTVGGAINAPLAAPGAGPVFLDPAPPPNIAITSEWAMKTDAAEVAKLGCALPAPPSLLDCQGKISPPGRLQFRAHGSVVEARLTDAAPGISARLDALELPSLQNLIKISPVPITLSSDTWTRVGSGPEGD